MRGIMTATGQKRGTSPEDLSTDVVIVGGGLVGGALAAALASAGIHSVVVDAEPPATQTGTGFDGRASAVAQAPKRMLSEIGIWAKLPEAASPILDIRVSDGESRLFLHYDHQEIGEPALGHMVENRHLRQAIFEVMANSPAITHLAPATVTGIERTLEGTVTALADGRTIRAPLVVGADGRRSFVREAAAIPLTAWQYGQAGIVCTVHHERSHQNVAHERFLTPGPFAILPLTGNRASIVWTESVDDAARIMELSDADFLSELAERFGDFLGDLEIVSPRWSYPLSLQFAQASTDRRLALTGDAAHAMHPIAGQGLNMGYRDVAALAEVLADAKRLGLDMGAPHILAKFERWRRFDNMLMLASTDGLNRLFSNDIRPVKLARDLGLAAVNLSGPLKKLFMRHAMGLAGNLPRLLKGEAL